MTLLLINAGRMADLKGRKKSCSIGFVVFTPASTFCGLSVTDLQLVFFIALQGARSAFIIANKPTDTFRRQEWGRALGINTMTVYNGLMEPVTQEKLGVAALASGIHNCFCEMPHQDLTN